MPRNQQLAHCHCENSGASSYKRGLIIS